MKPVAMSRTGRLTLPAPARRTLGLSGEAYFEVEIVDGGILLRPVTAVARDDVWVYAPENLARIERGLEDLRAGRLIQLSPADLEAYVDWAEAAADADGGSG
jgi:AbrB family looped-hinge helix DNA binding protein